MRQDDLQSQDALTPLSRLTLIDNKMKTTRLDLATAAACLAPASLSLSGEVCDRPRWLTLKTVFWHVEKLGSVIDGILPFAGIPVNLTNRT